MDKIPKVANGILEKIEHQRVKKNNPEPAC
jgi:hypothetical protein